MRRLKTIDDIGTHKSCSVPKNGKAKAIKIPEDERKQLLKEANAGIQKENNAEAAADALTDAQRNALIDSEIHKQAEDRLIMSGKILKR